MRESKGCGRPEERGVRESENGSKWGHRVGGKERPLYLKLLGPGAVPVGQSHPLDKELSL